MPEQRATDAEWITRAKGGDERAFRELVEAYEGQVAATVVGMLGPGDEADDVGQETFIRFYQSLGKFRGEAAVGTYLTRIAMNLSLNAIERRKRLRWRFWSRDDEENAPVEPGFDGREERDTLDKGEQIQAALLQINPDFRAVVVLRMLEGYSTRETAQMLDIAEGTVLSRLARGIGQLQRVFKDEVDAI